MTLAFAANGRAELGPVAIWITADTVGLDPVQQALAETIAGQMPALLRIATTYLDMFIDRARASGKTDELWFLDEIDLRQTSGDRPIIPLSFTLDGDDNGLWTLDMRMTQGQFWPVRFERLQQ